MWHHSRTAGRCTRCCSCFVRAILLLWPLTAPGATYTLTTPAVTDHQNLNPSAASLRPAPDEAHADDAADSLTVLLGHHVARDSTDSIYSHGLTPFSTALHVLPPLGAITPILQPTDRTLTDYLLITICTADTGDCTPVYQYTSHRTNNNVPYITLHKDVYHVNWTISRSHSRDTFQIHFIVAGLDLDIIQYTPRAPRTVPIRFSIEHHPTIRAAVLKQQGYSAVDIILTIRDAFALTLHDTAQVLKEIGVGAHDALAAFKQLGLSEYMLHSIAIAVYNTYAAIVNIQSTATSTSSGRLPPQGLTGLPFCQDLELPKQHSNHNVAFICAEPYIPGLFGTSVLASDINYNVGGDWRYVYIKYALVPADSDTPVVTGLMAAHWPSWNPTCPQGWVPVGPLTSETDCYTMGMCARYQPFNEANAFVTTAVLSINDPDNANSKCTALCRANSNIWPMYTDSTDEGIPADIHLGCGDDRYLYLCYNQAEKWPARPLTMKVDDSTKVSFLEQYAPRVVMAADEYWYPSSVEWSFDYLYRYSPNDLPPFLPPDPFGQLHLFYSPDTRYYVAPLDEKNGTPWLWPSPSSTLPYFHGCIGDRLVDANGNPLNGCELSDAPAYGFWNKQSINLGGEVSEVVDLTYFFYYPYNRGKEIASVIYGSHVGDWEHVTVRLSWVFNLSSGWEIAPIQLLSSAHSFGTPHPWETITRVPDSDHPVVFAATESHGLYVTASVFADGQQLQYATTPAGPLHDYTGGGEQWDTWSHDGARLETFEFDEKRGLGFSTWPRWMSTEYELACAPGNPQCDPYNPASGPIFIWGTERCCVRWGQYRLSSGPTGPAEKENWESPYKP